jgi:hypothetical protein
MWMFVSVYAQSTVLSQPSNGPEGPAGKNRIEKKPQTCSGFKGIRKISWQEAEQPWPWASFSWVLWFQSHGCWAPWEQPRISQNSGFSSILLPLDNGANYTHSLWSFTDLRTWCPYWHHSIYPFAPKHLLTILQTQLTRPKTSVLKIRANHRNSWRTRTVS